MAFADRELTCRDCGGAFIFTAGEQEFYASKGLQNDPVRCPSCRATRKLMRPQDREEIPSYGVYVSWGGRTPRQLHVATCSGCARSAEVPFVPRGDRPVFCSECYNEERKRQEAQEHAEVGALAARATGARSSSSADEFEGSGRDSYEEGADSEDADKPDAESDAEAAVEAVPSIPEL